MNGFDVEVLRRRLAGDLPGATAHRTMMPPQRTYAPPPADESAFRRGAVLLLLVPTVGPLEPEGSAWEVPFIRRTHDGGPHSGQIALPGGAAEDADRDSVDTAIREAGEEIGVDARYVEPLGTLSPLWIDVSGFVITPVVGVVRRTTGSSPFSWYDLRRQEDEVADILRIPVCGLADTISSRTVTARSLTLEVPSYRYNGDVIWGATAMIVAEFLAVCRAASCCLRSR